MTQQEAEEKMPRGPRARAALSRFAPLAWFRSPLERHPQFGYVQIAHLGWRFAEPHDELQSVFEAVVHETALRIDWEFKVARNWLILPSLLAHETRNNGGDFSKAEGTLTREQDLCTMASEDMNLILEAIEAAAPRAA
ncbi:hypothetical protein [Streptomyces erythrochromogenes]|uniref:hypothetical protein n=1 Tax=Streptomyces erythrochromogenes TaxID=285574 RepID=UPI0004CCB107|nr:hypothetical protein [Streptomyces erythrochromogenes]